MKKLFTILLIIGTGLLYLANTTSAAIEFVSVISGVGEPATSSTVALNVGTGDNRMLLVPVFWNTAGILGGFKIFK